MALSGLLSAVESIQVRTLLPQVPNLLLLSAQTPNLLFLASQRTQIQGALTGFTSLSPLLGSGIIAHLITLATPPTFTNIVTLATPPTYTNITTLASGTTFLNLSSIGVLPSVANLVTIGRLSSVTNLVTVAGYTSTGMGNLTSIAAFPSVANLLTLTGYSGPTMSNLTAIVTFTPSTSASAAANNLVGFYLSPNYPTAPAPVGGGFATIGAWFLATFAVGALPTTPLSTFVTQPGATTSSYTPSLTFIPGVGRLGLDMTTGTSVFNVLSVQNNAPDLALSVSLLGWTERTVATMANTPNLNIPQVFGAEVSLLRNVHSVVTTLLTPIGSLPPASSVTTSQPFILGLENIAVRLARGPGTFPSTIVTELDAIETLVGTFTPSFLSSIQGIISTLTAPVTYSVSSPGTVITALSRFFTTPSFPATLGVATNVTDVVQSLSDWCKNGLGIQSFLNNFPGVFLNEFAGWSGVGPGTSVLVGHQLGIAAGTFFTGNNGLGGATGIDWFIAWKSGVSVSSISGPNGSGVVTVTWSDGSTTNVNTGQTPSPSPSLQTTTQNPTWGHVVGMVQAWQNSTEALVSAISGQSNWQGGIGGNVDRIEAKADFHRWMFEAFVQTMGAEVSTLFGSVAPGLASIAPLQSFGGFTSFRSSPPSGLPLARKAPAVATTSQASYTSVVAA